MIAAPRFVGGVMMKFNPIVQRIVLRQHRAHLGFHGGIPNIDEHAFIFS